MTPVSDQDGRTLARLASLMASSRRVTALTGAGVSAASGVPTFRGSGGLWRSYDPMTLATPQAFARDPALVWEWYDWRRQKIAAAAPNAAHHVLAAWMRVRPGFTLITQNVDGLHEQATTEAVSRALVAREAIGGAPVSPESVGPESVGPASVDTTRLVRLHGSIWQVRCTGACGPTPREDRRAPLPELPPRCADCGALLRPDVVWFGEALDPAAIDAAARAAQCDLFLTIGTSAAVYPAAGLIHEARAAGATIVEINPDETDASDAVDLLVRGKAEEILPALDRLLAGA